MILVVYPDFERLIYQVNLRTGHLKAELDKVRRP
jgi:hypothetical protein